MSIPMPDQFKSDLAFAAEIKFESARGRTDAEGGVTEINLNTRGCFGKGGRFFVGQVRSGAKSARHGKKSVERVPG